MEVLFLVAVCCGLPVLVAIGMSVPKLFVMIGMSLSKSSPRGRISGDPALPTSYYRRSF